jgi:hypothetical protein
MWPWNSKEEPPAEKPCLNCVRLAHRLSVLMKTIQTPMPCVICGSENIVGLGYWTPNEREKLAVGVAEGNESIIGFWVCQEHATMDETKEESRKIIAQAITRLINERGLPSHGSDGTI